jgi:simple sugar transport system substrate-binding protein
MKQSRRRQVAVVAAAISIVAGTSACSSGGGSSSTAGSAGKDFTITVVSGPLSDPFFSAIKSGTEAAAKDLGITVTYTAPKDLSNPVADITRLQTAALAGKPDAIVISEFLPEQDPGIQKFSDAGVPTVFMNAGPNWEKLGGLNYVGEDPVVVGRGVGQRFVDAGKKNVLCVAGIPGNPVLEARCNAMDDVLKANGGKSTRITLAANQGGNPTAVGNAISGALRKDDTIDAVFTLGSALAESAARYIDAVGSRAILGTTDLSTNVLNLVKSGDIAFAADQQPYLTGYYSVLIAAQYLQAGLHPVGPIDTAPNWITKDNVDEVIKSNRGANGIRGAA